MKLLVILSVIAIGYADKLDRTYLPPSNAASAGGSPGDLTAPAIQSGPSFGQGLSPGLGSTPRPAGFTQRPPVFSQGSAGIAQGPSGFGQGPSGVAQGPSGFGQGPFGVAQGPSGFGQGPSGVAQGPSGFGQGPSGFGQRPSGIAQGPSGFGQGSSGVAQGPSGFGQGPSGVAQGPSGFNQGLSIFGQGPSVFSQGPSTFGKGPSVVGQGSSSFGQGPSKSEQPSNGLDLSNKGVPSGNGFVPTKTGATPGSSYGAAFETRVPSAPLGFGSSQLGADQAGGSQLANGPFNQGFGQGPFGPTGPQAYTPERAQASADRSATILNYYNENNGDSYKYNYETSNGISAGEEGVATNGVRAQGGYSYIGDDGVSYSVTYTADENGFQPRGDHLPTPPPIPEEILKSIEENARAAAAGTQEGAYRPEEYESEAPLGQYNAGAANFNQPQGPSVGAVQGPQSTQSQFSRPESNQFPGSLNQFTQSPISISGQNGQQSAGSLGQFNEKASAGLGQIIQNQGQGTNGYNYKQPQNNFEPTGFGQRPSSQFRPQPNAQEQKDFSVNIGSNKPGFKNQGSAPITSGSTGVSSLGGSQTQYQTGLGQSNTLSGNKADTQFNGNQPAFGSNIGSNQGASQFGAGNQAFGSGVSATAGVRDSQPIQAPYQYNRPSQGFDSQPQRPGFNGPQSPTPVSQGIQRGPEQFGGPRQPPSFSPEQGYKY